MLTLMEMIYATAVQTTLIEFMQGAWGNLDPQASDIMQNHTL